MSYPTKPEHITVDWLTDVLAAQPGEILSVSTKFVGDAVGNTSDVHFISIQSIEGSNVPRRLVGKMLPQAEASIEVGINLKMFEREISAYRSIAEKTPITVPELVWGGYDKETSLGFLLMEDCSAHQSFDQTQPVPSSLKVLQSFVSCAARLHATWWNTKETPAGVFHSKSPVYQKFGSIIAEGWADILNGGEGFETIPTSGLQHSQKFADVIQEKLNGGWPLMHKTIGHTDFRVDNLFYNEEKNEPILFDWQCAAIAPGPFDIAYLLATGYEVNFRREHEMDLLRRYHSELVERGVSGYSFDECLKDYRLGMANNMWVVPFTAIMDLSSDRGQALTSKVIGGIYSAIADFGGATLVDDYIAC